MPEKEKAMQKPSLRQSVAYQEAVVKKKSQEDPKEVAIREKIASKVLRESWAEDAFAQIRSEQLSYMKDMVTHAEERMYVRAHTQDVIRKLSRLMRTHIVEGGELLEHIPKGSAVIIATNHFGSYKLCAIKPKEDLGVSIPHYDAMYPYLMYFAALAPVAEQMNDELSYASEDFPGVFGTVHTNAGFIHVPPSSVELPTGRTAYLIEQTRNALQERPNTAIVNFPEGGTSGKYTGMGPYDLDPFKTGGYVIAANLGMYLVPVAQYFDKDSGMQLKILEPVVPPQGASKDVYEGLAEKHRQEMQRWLDARKDR